MEGVYIQNMPVTMIVDVAKRDILPITPENFVRVVAWISVKNIGLGQTEQTANISGRCTLGALLLDRFCSNKADDG
jgi:hypothetical protein